MVERPRRSWFSRTFGRRAQPADVDKLTQMFNESPETIRLDGELVDGKTLASLAKIGTATSPGGGAKRRGAHTQVSYSLLRDISLKSEVVNAILRRTVDDTLANGYDFVLAYGKEEGSKEQKDKLVEFFRNPNPDDMGDEWLEAFIYDLALFGDAYLELDGSDDRSRNNEEDWIFGGELVAVWPIPADTITIIPSNQTPKPPAMAYLQTINKKTRRFSADKVIHATKFRHGRGYGTSPLIPLLNTIAGQLNLSNYLNELYTGTLPKTILNVGDISNAEMKAMLGLIEQQLAGGKSPFGLIAINGGTGFNLHRIIDSTREGMQLDMLYYYREEICAVFGIPPMKLGWVQTGKLANPEQQLDAWYDVVESYQHRISAMLNNRILPLLGITDWRFKFQSIRPKRDKERADILKSQAQAVATLRQEGAISINEARELLGYEQLKVPDANDPLFVSPKLSINMGAEAAKSDGDVPNLLDLFPTPPIPDDEGQGAGEFPKFDEPDVTLDGEVEAILLDRRHKQSDEFDSVIDESSDESRSVLNGEQAEFAKSLLATYDSRFAAGDEAIPNPNVELSLPMIVRKDEIDLDDIQWAIAELDANVDALLSVQAAELGVVNMATYKATLALTAGSAIAIALTSDDQAALSYWNRRWVLPALRRTLGSHRESVVNTFQEMIQNGRSWSWARNAIKSSVDPTGERYPNFFYDRIARTETRRVVENAHISGLQKAGFRYVQRLVEQDTQTDKELCAPFANSVYRIGESGGVIPAHPNCRCSFTAHQGEQPPLPSDDVLRPSPEGAEI